MANENIQIQHNKQCALLHFLCWGSQISKLIIYLHLKLNPIQILLCKFKLVKITGSFFTNRNGNGVYYPIQKFCTAIQINQHMTRIHKYTTLLSQVKSTIKQKQFQDTSGLLAHEIILTINSKSFSFSHFFTMLKSNEKTDPLDYNAKQTHYQPRLWESKLGLNLKLCL